MSGPKTLFDKDRIYGSSEPFECGVVLVVFVFTPRKPYAFQPAIRRKM